ncbi:hypothetical protein, partial [Levilactobacillus brevis]|uniref:hypothetical protein n=1 Tax=Levilactobacillus brevis TaxID=1580 RepID=UPI00063AEC06
MKDSRSLVLYYDIWCFAAIGLLVIFTGWSFPQQVFNTIVVMVVTFLWMRRGLSQVRQNSLYYRLSWYLRLIVLGFSAALLIFAVLKQITN